ncbi:hypothetical protein [Streptomyces sp. NPDC054874]
MSFEMPTAMFAWPGDSQHKATPRVFVMYGPELRLLLQDPKTGGATESWVDENEEEHRQSFKNSRHYTQFTEWRNLGTRLGSGPVDTYMHKDRVCFLLGGPGAYQELVFDPKTGEAGEVRPWETKLGDALKKHRFTVTALCMATEPDALLLLGSQEGKPRWCVWNLHDRVFEAQPAAGPLDARAPVAAVLSGYDKQNGRPVLRMYAQGAEVAATVQKKDKWAFTPVSGAAEFLGKAGPRK